MHKLSPWPRFAQVCCVLAVGSLLAGCAEPRPWNVVLFTFDTTRADFLGCYGKDEARTPHLDALAAEGFLFEHALASNPVTQAAHSTILTGVYPMVHGVRDNLLFRLPEEQQTLAERLRAEGYATAAAVGGFPLVRSFGSQQGFDFYDDDLGGQSPQLREVLGPRRRRTWYDERPAGHVNDAILPWLRERFGREQPFFAWLHYWDPHEPHIPPAPYDQLFAHDLYSGEIAYADQSLGALLAVLDEAGELDRTVVVMVADHGESRMDHGEATHAYLAYDTTLHVPLIVRVPGEPATAGRRIAERVGTVDIVPTILDLLGLEVDPAIQGRSLAPLMLDSEPPRGPRVDYYSESLSPRLSHGAGELRALYRGPYKYIHGPRPELFDLDRDPAELHDLAADRPDELARFEAQLQGFLDRHASASAADAVHEVDEATRQRLEALGYLSTHEATPGAVQETLSRDGAVPQDHVGDINRVSRLRNEMGSGQFRRALRTVRQLLDADPDNPYFLGRLAIVHLGLGELDAAVAVVEGSEVSGASLDDFLTVAGALFDSGAEERGLALARRLVAEQETVAGRMTLARMARQQGDDSGFETEIAATLALDPEHRGARLLRAEHRLQDDDPEAAEPMYRELLAERPLDLRSLLGLAESLRRTERAAEALPHIERVTRLAPGACAAHREHLEILVALTLEDHGADGRVVDGVEAVRGTCGHDPEALTRADEVLASLGGAS